MKKKWLWLVITMGLIIIGTMGVGKMTKEITKEKQISFLKEHEEEMTDYIKVESNNVSRVNYNWKNVKVSTIGNGLPNGSGKVIQIFGYVVSETKEYSFRIDINLAKNMLPDISKIHYGHAPNMERK